MRIEAYTRIIQHLNNEGFTGDDRRLIEFLIQTGLVELSYAGAATDRSPRPADASTNAAKPGASIPSSLLTRIFTSASVADRPANVEFGWWTG